MTTDDTTQYAIMWRDDSGSLFFLNHADTKEPITGPIIDIGHLSEEILTDPDAIIPNIRYAITTHDTAKYFGIEI